MIGAGCTWPSEGTVDSVMRRPRVLASRSAFTRLTELVVICAPRVVLQHVASCFHTREGTKSISWCCTCACSRMPLMAMAVQQAHVQVVATGFIPGFQTLRGAPAPGCP